MILALRLFVFDIMSASVTHSHFRLLLAVLFNSHQLVWVCSASPFGLLASRPASKNRPEPRHGGQEE